MKVRRWRSLAAQGALLFALLPAGGACLPAIEITQLPPYGVDGFLLGTVDVEDPSAYEVAPFIQIEGAGWWTKPSFSMPTVPIAADGSFSADVASGGLDNRATLYCVYLVAAGADVPLAGGDYRVPAGMDNLMVANTCAERYVRTFTFAGREWGVKEAPLPVGPGGNLFSDHVDDVFVDSEGRLHLWLRYRAGDWWASEVILTESLGFGTYLFRTESDLDGLDANVVFGAFLWDPHGDETSVPGAFNREIDSEDARWSNPFDPNGAQWALAPFEVPGNVHRYRLPALGVPPYVTRFISWDADEIVFTALAGQHTPCDEDGADLIDRYVYTANPALNWYIPTEGRERFRFNLWLNDTSGPSDGQDVEVIISDFGFFPIGDSDCDGVRQESDNCIAVANPAQRDTDADDIGNICDPDIAKPNDCTVNFRDLLVLRRAFFSTDDSPNWNPDADFDGDGVVNFADAAVMRQFFFQQPGPSANGCN